MAVANTKSNAVTNADAQSLDSPTGFTPLIAGKLKEQAATLETAAADDAGSVYRMFRVHTTWRLAQILTACDAVTNMSTADLGFYETAENGGAAIDIDAIASAVTLASALGLTDHTFEDVTVNDKDDIEKNIYQRFGFTGSHRWVDIAWTATTNDPTAAATISGLCRYVEPSY